MKIKSFFAKQARTHTKHIIVFLGVNLLVGIITTGISAHIFLINYYQTIEDKAFSRVNTAYANVEFKADRTKGDYKYNERVPEDVVRAEIKKVEERFNIKPGCMDMIVKCESGYNNLAKNPKGTALGIAQYLILTWQETESFKKYKIARTDFKPVLFEMGLDISTGEIWRWEESKYCWNEACK